MAKNKRKRLTPEEWLAKKNRYIRRERARNRARENPADSAERAEVAEAKRVRRNEKAKARPYKIYRVTFADGCVYVGCTSQYLSTRLAHHRARGTTLGRRLDMYPENDWVIHILAEFPRAEKVAAFAFESAEWAKVPILKRLDLRSLREDDQIVQHGADPVECRRILESPELLAALGYSPEPKFPRVVEYKAYSEDESELESEYRAAFAGNDSAAAEPDSAELAEGDYLAAESGGAGDRGAGDSGGGVIQAEGDSAAESARDSAAESAGDSAGDSAAESGGDSAAESAGDSAGDSGGGDSGVLVIGPGG